MSVIIIDNGLVHYEAIGRGRPVIFLHGWLGSWRYWMPTMEALADRYRTYAFDLWGFGDSDHNPQRYDIESYVTQLELFIDNMGLSELSFSLVGHALGAAIALLYAGRFSRADQKSLRIMAVSTPMAANAAGRRLTVGGGSLLDRVLGRRGAADYPEVEIEAQKADPNAVAFSARSITNLELGRILERIDLPLLLVHGEKDPFIALPAPDQLHMPDKNVKPITLADSRHFPMLDEAAKFQRLLKDFLEAKPEDLTSLALKEEWRRRTH
ncbi:MAG TPA: alpha/beta hydrolase [Anaerolineae bacterium]|nr:alpha/beta hydrolase [Anaerolineae bacterium]